MTVRQILDQVLEELSDDRVAEVLDFAAFLRWQGEQGDWQRFGLSQFAQAYGPDEPDYSIDDIQAESGQ